MLMLEENTFVWDNQGKPLLYICGRKATTYSPFRIAHCAFEKGLHSFLRCFTAPSLKLVASDPCTYNCLPVPPRTCVCSSSYGHGSWVQQTLVGVFFPQTRPLDATRRQYLQIYTHAPERRHRHQQPACAWLPQPCRRSKRVLNT